MTVKLYFFGELKSLSGCDETSVAPPAATSVGELFKQRKEQSRLSVWTGPVLFAVNHEQVGPEYVIQDGDEVAFMPPMTGG